MVFAMRTLERNKRKFHYCLFSGKEPLYDEYGRQTGEYRVVYGEPVEALANISPATGASQTELFGQLDDYDKVIVIGNPDTPIDESAVLFIDKEPEFKAETVLTLISGEDEHGNTAIVPGEKELQVPVYDYTVRRVARSINSASIAVSKVKIS